MKLDDLLEQRRKEISASRPIEPRSEECLPLADLMRFAEAPTSIPAPATDHMKQCKRCGSLHTRMVEWLADPQSKVNDWDVDDAFEPTTRLGTRRRFWEVVAVVSPLASAACLVLAIRFAAQAPLRMDPLPDLHESVKTTVHLADKTFYPLTENERVSTNVDELREDVKMLRQAIRDLLNIMGEMLTEVEQARELAVESEP